MNKNITDSLQEYLDDLIQKALQKLRRENYSFMKLQEQQYRLYDRVEEILQTLPSESKQKLEDFLDLYGMVSGQQNEFLYCQGIKDSISILKSLEVL